MKTKWSVDSERRSTVAAIGRRLRKGEPVDTVTLNLYASLLERLDKAGDFEALTQRMVNLENKFTLLTTNQLGASRRGL